MINLMIMKKNNIINFDDLTERLLRINEKYNFAKRLGTLYRYVDFNQAKKDIEEGYINRGYGLYKGQPCICTTRDKLYNINIDFRNDKTYNNLCYVLDGDKISNNYRIRSWCSSQETKAIKYGYNESEEDIIANKIPFKKYVKKVWFYKQSKNIELLNELLALLNEKGIPTEPIPEEIIKYQYRERANNIPPTCVYDKDTNKYYKVDEYGNKLLDKNGNYIEENFI